MRSARIGNKRTEKQKVRDSWIIQKVINKRDVEKDHQGALSLFMRQSHKLSNVAYWETLRALWIGCGKRENYQIFKKLFRADRDCRTYLMTASDWRLYMHLPANLTIYRAIHEEDDDGLSWTTSKEFAEKYAKAKDREVVSRQVHKTDIFAYFNSRNEEEVILIESLAVSPLESVANILQHHSANQEERVNENQK